MEFSRDRFDKFTERARKVLTLAQEEATLQHSSLIGTEHILLGLVSEGQGVAAKVLENLGVHLPQLRTTIISLQAQQPPTTPSTDQNNELTPEAKDAIHLATEEAQRLNHHYIGTEHLLLGLLRQPDSLAHKALQAQNLNLERVRTMTIQVISQSSGIHTKFSLRRKPAQEQEGHDKMNNRDRFDRFADNNRFDKFTERARKVLSLAQEEAQRFQHNYIGTEHLLLGLVRENDGVAAKALNKMDVSLNKVRDAVEFIIGRGDRIVLGEIGLTPRAKKVIELAVDEARRLNHHYIGTEHLLLGLIREGEGIAAGVLESLGVQLGTMRSAVIATLEHKELPDEEKPNPEDQLLLSNTMHVVHHVTQQTYQAFKFADSERERLHHPTFGTEHLLLGLLYDTQSATAILLKELGIELASLYPAIDALQVREELPYPWSTEYTTLARAQQDLAGHEAMLLKHDSIHNGHVLLALLRFPESNAVKILVQLGAEINHLRTKLLEQLQQG